YAGALRERWRATAEQNAVREFIELEGATGFTANNGGNHSESCQCSGLHSGAGQHAEPGNAVTLWHP
ncbi:hypothetical protein P2G82_23500, partial [Citrobacter braakii]|uniref:hypothetical protein n=1 Tax=Citrobacter braakii TaxID=57706 RepID=UPI0024DE3C06